MDTTHTSNALKCVQTSSATSTQTSTVFEAGSKSLSRTTTKKINPLGLDAFDTDVAFSQIQMPDRSIDLQHLSKRLKRLAEWNCALRFHRWLPPQHLHTFGPKFTAPRPLHRRSHNLNTNWCQRPWYLPSRLRPRPDNHETHSESNLEQSWCQEYCGSLNSKRLVSKSQSIWNRSKSLKKHFWCCCPAEQNGYDPHIKRA